ncbi:hypothetical protein, partial [Clavibacter michiganensis]|uniref:hypothetical protein n=1 Tax=Clavibacter michiganensis TaxID=28447 RepID=UPI001F5BBDF6
MSELSFMVCARAGVTADTSPDRETGQQLGPRSAEVGRGVGEARAESVGEPERAGGTARDLGCPAGDEEVGGAVARIRGADGGAHVHERADPRASGSGSVVLLVDARGEDHDGHRGRQPQRGVDRASARIAADVERG